MRTTVRALIGVAIVVLLAACGPASESEDAGDAQDQVTPAVPAGNAADTTMGTATPEFSSASAIGMELFWRVVENTLEVKASAPTTGWLAVGFDPSRMMRDANILIGYVAGETTVVTDQFGVTGTSHRPDEEIGGRSDVTVLGGSETNGRTELHFSIPLDSGDERDRPLSPGGEYTVILAYGENGADDVDSYHRARGSVRITL